MVNVERSVLRMMRVVDHPVEVTTVEDFTSYYRRIGFHAPELVASLDVTPTLWFRLWLPGQKHSRGYTYVNVDEDAGTFEADFVTHGTRAPGSSWAIAARPGVTGTVAMTPAHLTIPGDAERWFLFGDLTALPAINTLIETAPAGVRIAAAVEDGHDAHAELPVASHPALDFAWVEPARDEHGLQRGRELTAWLRRQDPGDAPVYAWGAGERSIVKQARPVLKGTWGLERGRHFTQAYWIEGRSNG